MNNRFFSQKPRNCPQTNEDVELLVLKVILNLALLEGCAASYQERIFIEMAGEELVLFRSSEDASSIVIKPDKLAFAVDLFVQQFIFEAALDISALRVHAGDSTKAAISLHQIAKKLTVTQLYNDASGAIIMPAISLILAAEQHTV